MQPKSIKGQNNGCVTALGNLLLPSLVPSNEWGTSRNVIWKVQTIAQYHQLQCCRSDPVGDNIAWPRITLQKHIDSCYDLASGKIVTTILLYFVMLQKIHWFLLQSCPGQLCLGKIVTRINVFFVTCNTFTHAPLHTHDCSNDHHWHEHVDVCTTLFPQSSSVVFVGLNGVRALPLAVELLATINGIL
jgi:hypothetical protein